MCVVHDKVKLMSSLPDLMRKSRVSRFLIVTRNLPPLVGGMERLNWHMAEELSKRGDVHIIGPQGAAALCPPGVQCTEVPLQPLWKFLLCSTAKALSVAMAWKPDRVVAGSGLTAPAAWLSARAVGARASVYLHGLDAAVRHPVYQALWHPIIRRMDHVIVNSTPTANLAQTIGVDLQRISIVHPGVQLPERPQPDSMLSQFRQRHGLADARILLSIGRLTTRKGLREFVEHALPTIVRHRPDTLLLVIGDAPANALYATHQTQASIQSVAEAAGIGRHLKFLGVITNPSELAAAYECASLHVFPVRCLPGDPEGFGMVAIEAAAHGVPTIAFATGGVVDAVSSGESGTLVTPGDYCALAREVLSALERNPETWRFGAMSFSRQFAWSIFGDQLDAALKSEGNSRSSRP